MLTTLRLDPALKNRLKACAKFFVPEKNASDMIRFFVEQGSNEMLEKGVSSFIELNKMNIKSISQRYDWGEILSFEELGVLFNDFFFIANHREENLPHPDILISTMTMFLALLDSQLLTPAAQDGFKGETFIRKKDISFHAVKNFQEELSMISSGLKDTLEYWKKEPFVADIHSNEISRSYLFYAMARVFFLATGSRSDFLYDKSRFEQIVRPHLKEVIKVAKWRIVKNEKKFPHHFFNATLFRRSHKIRNMYVFDEGTIRYSIRFDLSSQELSFSSYLTFREKAIILNISFEQLNDLLRFSSLLKHHLEAVPAKTIIKGTNLELNLVAEENHPGNLESPNVFIHCSQNEFTDLVSLFLRISQEEAELIDSLQYQLGAI